MHRSVPFIARYDILSGKLSRFRAIGCWMVTPQFLAKMLILETLQRAWILLQGSSQKKLLRRFPGIFHPFF
jgi:hypothetical protein